ncbi:uncharacterized protein F4822DRAFT_427691 [Hypoxylon trugodes]|uniref:uncharacterized protein n=1 Tax=Hypoxylon trugodes TaxID=326681 RepID=UPI00219D5E07|nr:uncharacterized protein F4822DRAFT_427691 [Hypoxylon trugodes]KAI1389339.1 hypothetical protein F4822DRAFT_427691 [Hypoxylon trugodes]
MDFIRANVLRRGQTSDGQAQASQQQRQVEMGEQPNSRTRRFSISRPPMPSLSMGRSRTNEQPQRTDGDRSEDDSPKTPRFNLGLPNMPSTRLHVPNLNRPPTRDSPGPMSPDRAERPSEPASQPIPRIQTEQVPPISEPPPSHGNGSSEGGDAGRSRFRGADPGETHLADLVHRGRRHRRNPQSRRHEPEQDGRPKRFLFCFPWVRSRRIRSQILRCFVSGILLIIMLAVYLALSITKNVNSNEFTVLLVLVILFATIFFCHGLIRICMIIIKPPNDDDEERPPMPRLMEPGGYAVPRRPIHVILARDEEFAGNNDTANKLEPPAYGLWRESVRVDPDRLYWQRNEQAPTESDEESSHSEAGHARPPSYASEDGVSYVVEARPRSIVPPTEVPLPPHPSEVGRVSGTELI